VSFLDQFGQLAFGCGALPVESKAVVNVQKVLLTVTVIVILPVRP
jgi:hypothetical protein